MKTGDYTAHLTVGLKLAMDVALPLYSQIFLQRLSEILLIYLETFRREAL